MTELFQIILNTFKDFKNNLIIVVPNLIGLALFMLVAFFILFQVLIGYLAFNQGSPIPAITVPLVLYAIFFIIIDLILILLINSFTLAAQYGVMTDVSIKGISSMDRLFEHAKKYFRPMLSFTLAKYFILLVPLIPLAIVSSSAFAISYIAGIVISAFSAALYVFFAIAFLVLTVFSMPILISKHLSGFDVIVESLNYGRKNSTHVILTAIVLVILYSIISLLTMLVMLPSSILDKLFSSALYATFPFSLFSNVLSTLIGWIGGLIITLFIFNSYFDKNRIKNWK